MINIVNITIRQQQQQLQQHNDDDNFFSGKKANFIRQLASTAIAFVSLELFYFSKELKSIKKFFLQELNKMNVANIPGKSRYLI